MKTILKKIIIFTFIFFIPIVSVYAEAGFSGEGGSLGGGGGGGSSNGLFLGRAVMLKFTLIEVKTDKIIPLSKAYMMNLGLYETPFKSKNLGNYVSNFINNEFKSSKSFDKKNNCANCVVGDLTDNGYDLSIIQLEDEDQRNLTSKGLDFPNLRYILPSGKSYLTFNVTQLRKAVMKSETEITDTYKNIVDHMMELGNVTLDNLDDYNKYRMLIEPVYSLLYGKTDLRMFATSKAIANMAQQNSVMKTKKNAYGVNASELRDNLYAREQLGEIFNYPSFRDIDFNNPWDNIADGYNGIGYAIVRLRYDSPSCKIDKDNLSGNFTYYIDSESYNNINADTFESFISECTCDIIKNSSYREEILDNPELEDIYKKNCDSPTNRCVYEKKGSTYKYYDNDGNKVGSYSKFIDSCGCTNDSVLSLKNNRNFKGTYTKKCPDPDFNEEEKLDSDLADCADTDEYKTGTTTNGNVTKNIIDSGNESYNINYSYKRRVDKNNAYCTISCTENININNMVEKFKVMAGQYFKFSSYPQFVTNKSCTVDIKYENWEKAYESALENFVEKYNTYAKTYAEVHSGPNKLSPKSRKPVGSCECDANGTNCKQEYKYYYYVYEVNNLKITRSEGNDTYCGSPGKDGDDIEDAEDDVDDEKSELDSLLGKLETCNTHLRKYKEYYDFYDFKIDMQFMYDQRYINGNYYTNTFPNKYNHAIRPNSSLDDSNFNISLKKISHDLAADDYKREDSCGYSIIIDGNIKTNYRGEDGNLSLGNYCNRTDYKLDRQVEYTYNSEPSTYKIVNSHDYVITEATVDEIANETTERTNKIYLGNVYDTDVSSVARINENYYVFKALGDATSERHRLGIANGASDTPADKGQILNYITDNNRCKRGENCTVERSCKYKVENEIFDTCEGEHCDPDDPDEPENPDNPVDPDPTDKVNADYNVIYRSVEANDIDPSKRLEATNKGFYNWKNLNAKTVKANIEGTNKSDAADDKDTADPFNPEKLEYSFNLDYETIQAVRKYNKEHNYNDFDLKCKENGIECESEFVSTYATNLNGTNLVRDKWKYMYCEDDDNEKCQILMGKNFTNVFEKYYGTNYNYADYVNKMKTK